MKDLGQSFQNRRDKLQQAQHDRGEGTKSPPPSAKLTASVSADGWVDDEYDDGDEELDKIGKAPSPVNEHSKEKHHGKGMLRTIGSALHLVSDHSKSSANLGGGKAAAKARREEKKNHGKKGMPHKKSRDNLDRKSRTHLDVLVHKKSRDTLQSNSRSNSRTNSLEKIDESAFTSNKTTIAHPLHNELNLSINEEDEPNEKDEPNPTTVTESTPSSSSKLMAKFSTISSRTKAANRHTTSPTEGKKLGYWERKKKKRDSQMMIRYYCAH
jgi:hypothetical protein